MRVQERKDALQRRARRSFSVKLFHNSLCDEADIVFLPKRFGGLKHLKELVSSIGGSSPGTDLNHRYFNREGLLIKKKSKGHRPLNPCLYTMKKDVIEDS